MRPLSRLCLPAMGLLLAGVTGFAQQVISARAGMVNYVEGDVYLGDQAVAVKATQFPQLKTDQALRTADGRAEVLLTPGVFLRMAENSAFKLISDRLSDVRVEAQEGSLIVEAVEFTGDNRVALLFGGNEILIEKTGVYRLDAANSLLRVYSGDALVRTAQGPIEVKAGHQLQLDASLLVSKFDKDLTDSFYRWAARRSESIATANISSARSISRLGSSWTGGWMYNPFYGLFSYVPYGTLRSPYGSYYYSPFDAMGIYLPYYYYGPVTPGIVRSGSGGGGGSALGYSTVSRADRGAYSYSSPSASSSSSYGYTSSVASSSSSSSSSSSASAGATRGGGDSGSRGGTGSGHGK